MHKQAVNNPWETRGKTRSSCVKAAGKRAVILTHNNIIDSRPRNPHSYIHTPFWSFSTRNTPVINRLYTLSTQSIKTIYLYKERNRIVT